MPKPPTPQPDQRCPRGPLITATTVTATLLTLPFLFFVFVGLTDKPRYLHLARKDGHPDGTGPIEQLTVLVLLPGIAAAIFALVRFRRRFPSWRHALWLLSWTVACVYFAGEEMSWGQWCLGYETPDTIESVNRQGEFNLHNTTSWFNQKPQFLVEVFILFAGLILPVLVATGRVPAWTRKPWAPWVLAMPMCWAAAAYFVLVRGLHLARTETFITVDSELRELATAWFLSLYLMSYTVRLAAGRPDPHANAGPRPTPRPDSPPAE